MTVIVTGFLLELTVMEPVEFGVSSLHIGRFHEKLTRALICHEYSSTLCDSTL